jgi:hypothetical protein
MHLSLESRKPKKLGDCYLENICTKISFKQKHKLVLAAVPIEVE